MQDYIESILARQDIYQKEKDSRNIKRQEKPHLPLWQLNFKGRKGGWQSLDAPYDEVSDWEAWEDEELDK